MAQDDQDEIMGEAERPSKRPQLEPGPPAPLSAQPLTPRQWVITSDGIIAHSGECSCCEANSRHHRDARAAGEGYAIHQALAELALTSTLRGLMPIQSFERWRQQFPSEFAKAPIVLSPVSLLTYYTATFPLDVYGSEMRLRPDNRRPGFTVMDEEREMRRRRVVVNSVRELLKLHERVSKMVIPELYKPCAPDTLPAIWDMFPRALVGTGDPEHPREVVYPTWVDVPSPFGTVQCVIPSRPFTPFELDELRQHSTVLPRGVGGHTHLPGSLWGEIPHIDGPLSQLEAGEWDCPFKEPRDVYRLTIEVGVVPYTARSIAQRGFFHHNSTWLRKEHKDVWFAALELTGIHDMIEQAWAIGPPAALPLTVPGRVEQGTWRVHDYHLVASRVFGYCFQDPVRAARALRAKPQDDQQRRVPRYDPSTFVDDDYSPAKVIEHLRYTCGFHFLDILPLYEYARDSTDVDLADKTQRERSAWADLKSAHDGTVAVVPPLHMSEGDPPAYVIEAKLLVACYDKGLHVSRAVPAVSVATQLSQATTAPLVSAQAAASNAPRTINARKRAGGPQ